VKPVHVRLLAPAVFAPSLKTRLVADNASATSSRPPWFGLTFVALVCVNSVIYIPDDAKRMIVTLATFLLSVALAAMGLETISRSSARTPSRYTGCLGVSFYRELFPAP
jgi:uncharacterized membrane protein YadS